MPRAIWSGSISFGLVNIPVKLFSAVAQKEVRFHMLHDADGARIQQRRFCSAEDEEVPWEHVVKGYEVRRGRYVVVTPEELEAIDPKATRTIDISDFVQLQQIDPIYYENTYYVAPDEGAAKAYRLLHDAMARLGRVAVAHVVLRTKQYLCALRPMGGALVLSTMQYADEIRALDEIEELPAKAKPTAAEMKMAEELISSLASDFDPKKYHDEYREKVLELIARKSKGEEIEAPVPVERRGQVIDLMAALRSSLKKGKPEERPTARPARRRPARHRAPARSRRARRR
jgi:DNA end-binding protein Ku